MFSAGITFFPGSPQSVPNVQTYPTPTMFIQREPEDVSGGGYILDTGDRPILDAGDNGILEA
jgi:hypothetical protein